MKTTPWILSLFIAGVVFFVFAPCIGNGFVNWDDDYYVSETDTIQQLSVGHIQRAFSEFSAGNYQPLPVISFMVDHQIGSGRPWPFHLTNVALHACNSALAFWLFFLLTGQSGLALAVALLFGLHPTHVEPVAWVAARKDMLYGMFFISALIFYVRYVRQGCRRYYFASLFLFLAALLSKAMAVVLPFVLFLMDDYLSEFRPNVRVKEKIPFFSLALIILIVGVLGQRHAGAVRSENIWDIGFKLGVAADSIVFYMKKIFFPFFLSCFYPNIRYNATGEIVAFFILVPALFALGFWKKKNMRPAVFGAGLFLILLAPVLQFLPLGEIRVADRYLYLSSLGIFYLAAEAFFWLLGLRSEVSAWFKKVLLGAFVAVLFCLAILSGQRCLVWRNSVTLWKDAVAQFPSAPTPLYNLGLAYYLEGKYDDALEYAQRSLASLARWQGYVLTGDIYRQRLDLDRAMSSYQQAARIAPGEAVVYNNMGVVFYQKGPEAWGRAEAEYLRAIGLEKKALYYFNLGLLYEAQGDFSRARDAFSEAVDLDIGNTNVLLWHAADFFLTRGFLLEALEAYRRLAGSYPMDAASLTRIGFGLAQVKSVSADSETLFKLALRKDPPYVDALAGLGVLYARNGRLEEAIACFEKALFLRPGDAELTQNLRRAVDEKSGQPAS